LFSEWLSFLIEDGLAEGTVQKYASIVAQAIRLMCGKNHYGEITQKFLKAAGKINTPKKKKYSEMWDIHYAFNWVFEHFKPPSKYKDHVAQFIVVFRLLSGWRSSDLLGITRTDSIKKHDSGYYIRNWGTKTRQNSWSGFTFFPRMKHKSYQVFCIPSRIDALLEVSKNFEVEKIIVNNVWQSPMLTQATPDKDSGRYCALASSTIKQKVSDTFLKLVVMPTAKGKSLWQQDFRPHSLRHANASALRMMGVTAKEAAEHQQTSELSLQNTYTVQVLTDWEIPAKRVKEEVSLVRKLLLPFAHYHLDGDSF